MKILWITNSIFPAPSKELGNPAPIYGGWMYNLAENLALSNKLAIATVYDGIELKKYMIDNVVYYLLPSKSTIKYIKNLEEVWKKVIEEFEPDIVHIHGTEYAPALACMRSCPSLKYIISIQGLISAIANYYFGGIRNLDIIRNITFRDVVKKDT
ncbi:MAG: glycosyltransferase, partial [Ferruginibacter sp.]